MRKIISDTIQKYLESLREQSITHGDLDSDGMCFFSVESLSAAIEEAINKENSFKGQ